MKGIIADINGNKAVIISDKGEFITIRNRDYSIGQEITVAKKHYSSFIMTAACFVFVSVFAVAGYNIYYTPVSFMDVDINPSLRMNINKFGSVIGVEPLNSDAEHILSACGVLHGSIEQCMDRIIDISEENGYLNTSDNNIEVYMVDADEALYGRIEEYKTDILSSHGINTNVCTETAEELDTARNLDISIGKLKAIKEYSNASGESVENCSRQLKKQKNEKIRQLAKHLQHTPDEMPAEEIPPVTSHTDNSETTAIENSSNLLTEENLQKTTDSTQTKELPSAESTPPLPEHKKNAKDNTVPDNKTSDFEDFDGKPSKKENEQKNTSDKHKPKNAASEKSSQKHKKP